MTSNVSLGSTPVIAANVNRYALIRCHALHDSRRCSFIYEASFRKTYMYTTVEEPTECGWFILIVVPNQWLHTPYGEANVVAFFLEN